MSRYHEAHVDPQGPGDARPTALQIVHDEGLVGKLTNKIMLITGCTSGIGVETARALHATGATIYLAVRDLERGKKIVEDIYNSDPSNKAEVKLLEMDLSSFASVRAAVTSFLNQSDKLNVLVANAGLMATPEGRTTDGFETQFGTNHLGHFLLFQLLKPTLLASSTPSFHSRVVVVSSYGHRIGPVRFHDFNFEEEKYNPWLAYGQAKTANIWMANAIERHYAPKALHALSLHPGGIWTNLQKYVSEEQIKDWNRPEVHAYMKSTEQGAATSVCAALSREWEGKGGKYLSNCEVMGPFKGTEALATGDDGHATWAYDEEGEERLWEESFGMVGLEVEE